MKIAHQLIALLLICTSCKSEQKEVTIVEELKASSIAEKIAEAHGFENWKNVSKVEFTFKVDRDTIKGSGRSWEWYPKTDSIVMQAGEQVVRFNRARLDSVPPNADRNFINDKFWLLVPFQLVWDTTATISEPKKMESPIGKTALDMITLTYPDQGGYTPGDAYDIYYGKDYLIKEWVYRRGNSAEPSLTTTFENYKDFHGIKIAIDHKMEGGNWNLNFADVSITLDK